MSRRKVSSTAVLKNLPPERQQQVAEWCAKKNDVDADGRPIPETGGLAFARAQLAADGLPVALDTVSQFYKWWRLEEDLEISFEREDQVLAKTGDARKAREAGEVLLARLGLAQQNPDLIGLSAKISDSRRNLDLLERHGETKAAIAQRTIEAREKEVGLAIDKFQWDAAKAALAHLQELRTIAADRALSAPEKVKAVQLKLFGTPRTALEAPAQ